MLTFRKLSIGYENNSGWTEKVLEDCSNGVMEYWSDGVLEYLSHRVMESLSKAAKYNGVTIVCLNDLLTNDPMTQ